MVSVDVRGITKLWRANDHDSVLLVFQPAPGSASDLQAAVAAVDAAISAANAGQRNSEDGSISFACTESWPGPRGPVFLATIADTVEGIEAWTAAFAQLLEQAGWDGRLTTEKSQYPQMMRTNVVAMSAAVSVVGWAPRQLHRSVPGWVVDPALRTRITEWALEWTANGSDEIHLGLGMSMFRTPLPAARERLAGAAGAVLVNSPDLDHVRYVCLDAAGRLLVQLRDGETPWEQRLEALTAVLTGFADISDFGLVRYAHAGQVSLPGIVNGWPPPRLADDPSMRSTVAYYYSERHLDRAFVPDAFGTQVIGDAHLARTHDLDGWIVSALGGGKHLVQARDLAAWFATETPDLEMVARARRDFGNVILRGQPTRQPDPTPTDRT